MHMWGDLVNKKNGLLVLAALIMVPAIASAQYRLEPTPASAQSAFLACDFTSGGLTVAMFESYPSDGFWVLLDPLPEPGDRCLPLLSAAIAGQQPFWVGGGEVTNARLRSNTPESLLYTLSRADRTEYLVACRVQTGQGLVATEISKVTTAADATSLIGQPCLSVVGQLAAKSGYKVSGPVATSFGGQFSNGPVWVLNGSAASCESNDWSCQTKIFRCDNVAGGLVVTYVERSGDAEPDTSLVGQPCLDTLDKEQGPPEDTDLPRLRSTGPLPATQLEECLIFDFTNNGLRARALPDPDPD